jgi:hypothetical protein
VADRVILVDITCLWLILSLLGIRQLLRYTRTLHGDTTAVESTRFIRPIASIVRNNKERKRFSVTVRIYEENEKGFRRPEAHVASIVREKERVKLTLQASHVTRNKDDSNERVKEQGRFERTRTIRTNKDDSNEQGRFERTRTIRTNDDSNERRFERTTIRTNESRNKDDSNERSQKESTYIYNKKNDYSSQSEGNCHSQKEILSSKLTWRTKKVSTTS